jgi:short-subunit dehydrogenase
MELRKIIITGASSGLGREIAKKLATKANSLVLLGRDIGELESLQSEIQDKCGSISCISIDFSNQADMDLLISSNLLEGSSVLINSAADFGPTKSLLTTSLGDVSKAFQVNVLTPIMLS